MATRKLRILVGGKKVQNKGRARVGPTASYMIQVPLDCSVLTLGGHLLWGNNMENKLGEEIMK